ncbi:hypothetical protein LF1_14490 [Rubripirellula obstinata]|uniref:Uncharacterized protein n=1 Tax=Rubripirellula obstinata TaxID=406547 RepID=A0A5B1CG70_9BACT|nr:hypothetical protein [Rubripirellula obstinata]KAA1258925.1 hypothetical protein LF1_14490 [Rubripirellula obstinata]
MMTLDLNDLVEADPIFAHWRPPAPEGVEACIDYLESIDVSQATGMSSGQLKHEVDSPVRHADMLAAILWLELPCKDTGRYLELTD